MASWLALFAFAGVTVLGRVTRPATPNMPVRGLCAHCGGMVNCCFANTEEETKKIEAYGFDVALTDKLDAMLPHFPTCFAGEK